MSNGEDKQKTIVVEEGTNTLLANAVTKALEKKGWSLRSAQNYSGVHANTVDRLKKGFSVEPESLIQLAYAVADKGQGASVAMEWLRYANKKNIVRLVEDVSKNAVNEVPGIPKKEPRLHLIVSFDLRDSDGESRSILHARMREQGFRALRELIDEAEAAEIDVP